MHLECPLIICLSSQVVAIVMDIFTDVDLLSEVLDAAARRVPVYILLDEMNAKLFLDMAAKCRVNLNYVEVSVPGAGLGRHQGDGPVRHCRTGMLLPTGAS